MLKFIDGGVDMEYKDVEVLIQNQLNAGNIPEARKLAAEFITLDPANLASYRLLGRVYEYDNDPETATECYRINIPQSAQIEAFELDARQFDYSNRGYEKIAGHRHELRRAVSSAIRKTPMLNTYLTSRMRSEETCVHVIDNGSLWHDGINTVAVDADNMLISDATHRNAAPVMNLIRGRTPHRIEGKVVAMGSPGSNNYFHWMTDIIPKLEVLRKCGIADDENTTYVFRNVTQQFQKNTLAMVGIKPENIHVIQGGNEYVTADTIIVPSLQNRMCVTMGSWLPEYIKRTFLSKPDILPKRKILVSRDLAKSHGRGISNQQEVNDFYTSRGYEIIIPERYSLTQQAEIFAASTHVAGPHGAGLTNLLYCSPGTVVSEFYGEHFAPCYWAMSEVCELDYDHCQSECDIEIGANHLSDAKTVNERRSKGFEISLSLLETMHQQPAKSAAQCG